MTDVSPAEVLALVADGKLTLLHRPKWLDLRDIDALHAANSGCMNAAMRLASLLAADWTWRVGYDNLAEMAWREDPTLSLRVISLSQAHALLIATLQVLVVGPEGVRRATSGDGCGYLASATEPTTK